MIELVVALLGEWVSRKVYAALQGRVGPHAAGPGGILQPVADILKLLRKEETAVKGEDSLLVRLSAILSLTLSLYAFSLLRENPDYLILVLIALLSMTVFLEMITSYAQPNPFAYIAGGRWAELFAAYEIPLLLSIGSYTLISGGFRVSGIPAGVYAPASALVFFIAAMAKLEKNPFSIPNAESEISGGWLVDVSGRTLAMFRLSSDLQALFLSTLFLQMFAGLPYYTALILSPLILSLMAFVRARTARLRIDQAISVMWKPVTALALFNYALIFAVKVMLL